MPRDNNIIPLTLDMQEEDIPDSTPVEPMTLIDPVEWEAYMDDKLTKRLHFKLKQSLRLNCQLLDKVYYKNNELKLELEETKKIYDLKMKISKKELERMDLRRKFHKEKASMSRGRIESSRQNYNCIHDEIASINAEIDSYTEEAKVSRGKRKIDFDKKEQHMETQEDALQLDHTIEMANYTYATWKRIRRS